MNSNLHHRLTMLRKAGSDMRCLALAKNRKDQWDSIYKEWSARIVDYSVKYQTARSILIIPSTDSLGSIQDRLVTAVMIVKKNIT